MKTTQFKQAMEEKGLTTSINENSLKVNKDGEAIFIISTKFKDMIFTQTPKTKSLMISNPTLINSALTVANEYVETPITKR